MKGGDELRRVWLSEVDLLSLLSALLHRPLPRSAPLGPALTVLPPTSILSSQPLAHLVSVYGDDGQLLSERTGGGVHARSDALEGGPSGGCLDCVEGSRSKGRHSPLYARHSAQELQRSVHALL